MTGPGRTPAEQDADRRPPLQRAIPLRGLASPDAPDAPSEDSGSWGAPKLPSWPAHPAPAGTAPPPEDPGPATAVTTSPPPPAPPLPAPLPPAPLPSAPLPPAAGAVPAAPAVAGPPDAAHGTRHDLPPESAETTAGLVVTETPLATAGARAVPHPRLWLVPLVLIGAIVIAAAALAGRGPAPDGADTPVAIPPATFGTPATGQVTIITPSAGPSAATPSASPTPSPAAPTRTAPATPTPARSTAAAAAPAPATQPPAATGPITGYSACTTGSTAVLAVTFTKPFDWHHAYLDVDGNASTGYDVPDIGGRLGADYMVENDGFFRANDAEWDWSEIEDSGLQTSRTGGTYRWQLPRSALPTTAPLRVVFHGAGDTPDTNTPIITAGSC
ncbi:MULTISPECIES: hypothetical protein [Catenuloplanes]|uniref:Uncharacterized protein n=1 Tax=Catenuloplanes niger TaxID=587534 RepID=A0AAE4CTQ0_9ACTN|nr:hypothetical protein [Catenuloplanes niger]MDR7320924.1 hypothetical protein [Catenuloplanes niger]